MRMKVLRGSYSMNDSKKDLFMISEIQYNRVVQKELLPVSDNNLLLFENGMKSFRDPI